MCPSHTRILQIILTGLLAGTSLSGCDRSAPDPETEVRALISRAADATEQKQLGTLLSMLSPQYADEQGHDRAAVQALLQLYFRRHRNIHLYAHVQSVSLPQTNRVQASVLVAMAGAPIGSAQDIPAVQADLLQFRFEFEPDAKGWRVRYASWQRAELADFLLL